MTIQEGGAPAGGGGRGSADVHRPKLGTLMHSDPPSFINNEYDTNQTNPYAHRSSNASAGSPLYTFSPYYKTDPSPSPNYAISPWNPTSPFQTSPWIQSSPLASNRTGLIGSLVRAEGHIYSLAASDDLLYTGSDSKNIRVWKSLKDFSGFKSSSGLVKAIVISGTKIFTGHQDGKIRVWKHYPKNPSWKPYKRVGDLPTTKDFIKSSMNPSNYVKVRHRFNVPWIKHFDAVSCMSLDREQGILYSGSWDKTVKAWRISDSKCLESIHAHDDAVNSVVAGFEGLVLTGSADGTVKAWRRELVGKDSKHVRVQTLLKQESAVTALVANVEAGIVYCGSSDGLVNYWERRKHFLSHCGVLRGHKLAVLCLAAAGNLVLSGSADKSIGVWRREGGGDHTWLSALSGHCGPVKCLAVKEDEEPPSKGDDDPRWVVYSGSLDKSVKVWRLSEKFPVV